MEQKHPIRVYREQKLWSQTELARRAGVSLRTIVNIEKGHRQPFAITRRRVLKALRKPWKAQLRIFGPEPDVGRPVGS